MASCANCGARLPKASRFCPQCGHPSGAGETKELEVPPDETGRVPVDYTRAEARYYGITPTTLVLVLAAAALAVAVVLLATGHWPLGLIVLGVSVLLVVVFLEAGRRKPQGTVARSTAEALDSFRARAGVAADSLATRGRAARRVIALRRELQRMSALRARLLFELGDAVYRGDDQATETARGQVEELDQLAAQREAEMEAVVAHAQERLRRRKLEVQATEMVEIPEEPAAPGEQDPLGPAVIPEPYPPPDEGSPPQPAIIPEPGPLAPEPGPEEGRS
ncbi:MAG TPA: zinc-ribbon domain-containing protein [Gaiellaceae bacterium]